MIKYLLIFFNVAALCVYNFVFDGDVSVTPKSPDVASAGSEFVVELVINKGDVQGFAKLQQDLPKGFLAEAVETGGASFTFNNQSVKFIWTQLPTEKEFKISYKIKVEEDATGNKDFEGKFSYVVDNAKLSVAIPKTSVLITEKDENTPVVTKNDPKPVTQKEPEKIPEPVNTPSPAATPLPVQEVTCKRQMPSEAQENFVVEVIISKGNITGFAKLQEAIPDGFTASAIETNNSTFTFSDQQAKFVWNNLPSEAELKVSYKITVAKSLIAQKKIEGVFSYLENDETKKSLINESSIFVSNPSSGVEPSQIVADDPKPENPKPEKVKEPKSKEPDVVTPNIPSAQNGVDFKVQICALRKTNIETSYFASTYNITERINMENHEGWVKYTVGSFSEYKDARDHRESVRNKGITGPFVTSYNSGKRITVQEGLMITGQKWLR